MATAKALVTYFEWVHGGFAVATLRQLCWAPCSPVGAVAVPALMEN